VLAYKITVRNTGGKAARNVRVCDKLPDGQEVLRAPGANVNEGRVCWKLERLAAGAKRSFEITTQVDFDAETGRQVNRAVTTAANAPKPRADREAVDVNPAGGACRVVGRRC
jgi:hypothetical protein